jgi:hypothetical protein
MSGETKVTVYARITKAILPELFAESILQGFQVAKKPSELP